ncbi:MAG: hypothetical protein IJZ47_10740 [Oscillospiraceae bacterium]|nr:hypothetical protein [Oscillospiraceae bacterium]
MQLFYDRDDYRIGAVFVGVAKDRSTLIDYVFSKYLGDDYDEEEFAQKLEEIFVPENEDRDVECELREHFSAGMLNQMTYDFAVVFDEDITGADVRDFSTTSFRELISGSSISNVNEALICYIEDNYELPAPCNAVVILPTIYEGYYSHIKKNDIELWYLGTYNA